MNLVSLNLNFEVDELSISRVEKRLHFALWWRERIQPNHHLDCNLTFEQHFVASYLSNIFVTSHLLHLKQFNPFRLSCTQAISIYGMVTSLGLVLVGIVELFAP